MSNGTTSTTINTAIHELREYYRKKYGITVFTVKAALHQSSVTLTGSVIVAPQAKTLIQTLQAKFPHLQFQNKISILADHTQKSHYGCNQSKTPLDLCSQPTPLNSSESSKKKRRQSQLLPGEIIRILHYWRTYALVQKQDLTIGWVQKKTIQPTKKSWKHVKRGESEILFEIKRAKLIDSATSFLEVPYLLGGITNEGIDCSGLVQQVYWQTANILLPKHSQDQRRCGEKISLKKAQSGDLIFLDKKKTGFHHVALFIGNNQLIHASLRMKKVAIWDLNTIRKFYKVVSVRTLAKK